MAKPIEPGKDWTPYIAGSDGAIAATNLEIKLQFGTLFGQLAPDKLQKYGPVFVFESVNRLVRDGLIVIELKRTGRAVLVRYRKPEMGAFVLLN